MPDLDALRRLTAEMYLHTPHAPRTAQHAAASASHTAIRKAPVQRLAPVEQDARLRAVQGSITRDLLTLAHMATISHSKTQHPQSGCDCNDCTAQRLAQRLADWQGARVHS
jgi:hypothetical protein